MARIDQNPGIRPTLTIGRRLDIAARHAFPAFTTVMMMLLTELPLKMPGQAALLPAVALIAVWFWSLVRPSSMPPLAVFVIGFLLDLRAYLPLGSGVLTLLIAHGMAARFGRGLVQQGFAMVWLVFGFVATGAAALLWLLTALLTFRLLSPAPALFQAAITAALYPVLAIPFASAHRTLANPEQA